MEIKVEEVLRIQKERQAINHLKFEEIVWTYRGKPLDIPKELLDEFQFCGLNNMDFITSNFLPNRPWKSKEDVMPEINEQRERKNLDKATSYTGIWERGEVAKARGFTLISDEEIQKAWDNAFDKPINFTHKPTPDDIFAVREKAIAQAQSDSCEKRHLERLQEIKAGIEALHHPQATNMRGISISRPEWDSFWKGLGI